MVRGRPKIMVVDDDFGMRISLEAVIEEEGYPVVGVEDGTEAIELARKTPFDLIFMDVKMPGISGVDTYREIKGFSPETVVVMLTGYSVEGLIKEALEEGAYAVIYKPYAVAEILGIVKAVLKTVFVLVADDRESDREALRAVLEDSGYKVSVAADGDEVISMAAQRHYDIVLMDVRMPGLDGVKAFDEIRRVDPQAKVIFISGYDLEEPVSAALRSGAYAAVTKPADPEEMLALMRSVTSEEGRQ